MLQIARQTAIYPSCSGLRSGFFGPPGKSNEFTKGSPPCYPKPGVRFGRSALEFEAGAISLLPVLKAAFTPYNRQWS